MQQPRTFESSTTGLLILIGALAAGAGFFLSYQTSPGASFWARAWILLVGGIAFVIAERFLPRRLSFDAKTLTIGRLSFDLRDVEVRTLESSGALTITGLDQHNKFHRIHLERLLWPKFDELQAALSTAAMRAQRG